MPKQNLSRSGGPRTTAGRAAAAGNALKTGAYSRQAVLPGEDAAQFAALQAQLQQDFEPVGAAEMAMVQDLAALIWKKSRIERIEQAVMAQMVLLPLTHDRINNSFGPGFLPAAMQRLVPFSPVTQQEFDWSSSLHTQIQAYRDMTPNRRTRAALDRSCPNLLAVLNHWAKNKGLSTKQLLEGVSASAQTVPGIDVVVHNLDENAQLVIWLWQNREQLATAVQRATDSRLLEFMKTSQGVTQRAFDDVGRAFYRTLAELRRQQDWRIRRTAINIEDATPVLASGLEK